ncbi:conserved hypothetical protein [Uncinocarpus reesii 1704]|uniref:Mannosyltransferase n=1 Tax=Uncinocarpus reesii (strain UAMH 1704) TaxID=336963 RepID=C4JEU4_UNCRE|nr:uncharacterized protein UREG_02254 [Uncinocarpus reesii 1704]EEP77405.1 conserved hypothetical protein [Uncinocarpus reesii 1704]
MPSLSSEPPGSLRGDGLEHPLESPFDKLRRNTRHVRRHIQQRNSRDILLFLVGFRILNALCVRTFFQPDEFFQSLEPAWQIAFGDESGAWITWEWKHHLRSSIHPYIFATVYWIANQIGQQLQLSPLSRADLLIATPKATQGVLAALGDYYTWRLAGKALGTSDEIWWTLGLTVLSPWQWFCSTRTLSNCLETTLTVAALYYWPWDWSTAGGSSGQAARQPKTLEPEQSHLRKCLLLAALACILRPTNLIIWLCLVTFPFFTIGFRDGFLARKHVILIRESGYPLLLTTAVPFTLIGLVRAFGPTLDESKKLQASMRRQLATICIAMPMILSLISHKEVRFIYPLLPSLHVLTAPVLAKFFGPAISSSSRSYVPRRLLLSFLILVNLVVAIYTTITHASGPVRVLEYLRNQNERIAAEVDAQKALPQPLFTSHFSTAKLSKGLTVGFLMPCHSTPWRSHLVFPSIQAWALSCEPPVNFNESQRAAYLDEADQFYADQQSFLRTNMVGGLKHLPRTPTYQKSQPSDDANAAKEHKHSWPDYLVFFAQLEPTMKSLLRASSYAECYRTWNTAWHDDWRRKGDMVVWCIDPAAQREWREKNQRVHLHEDGWEGLMKSKAKQVDKIIEQLGKEKTGAWNRKRKQGNAWIPTFSLQRSSSWQFRKPFAMMDLSWGGGGRRSWYRTWSWPWEKRRKPSWSQMIRAWYDNKE